MVGVGRLNRVRKWGVDCQGGAGGLESVLWCVYSDLAIRGGGTHRFWWTWKDFLIICLVIVDVCDFD
jgi:hypothetical protein